ncbi:MAG: hypothetical protein ACLFUM_03420 [Spirochaetaceae bacterium]
MELSQLAEGLVRIDRGDDTYLGIATYVPTNRFAVTKLTGMPRRAGTIVRDGALHSWRVNGFTQHGDQLYIYGDYVEGLTLAEVLRYSADGFLPYLSRLTRAVETIRSQGGELPVIHTRSIVFLDDGGILFLPAEMVREVAGFQSHEDHRHFYRIYRHPDLAESGNLSYALAVLAYRSLTGEIPFDEDDEDQLNQRMRSGLVTNPRHIVPEIRPEVADVVQRALADPEGRLPRCAEWEELFQSWIQEGTHREISDEERNTLLEEAEAERRGMERTYRRRERLRKNWHRYVGITLIAVLIGTIPATVVYRSFEPPKTAGLEPEEVVEAFYYGMNSLDHELMEDATIEGAGRSEIREVTTMFVVSRMRTAVEQASGIIDAREWVAEGKPSVPEGRSVYGVTNLRLEAMRPPVEGEQAYRARYEKWYPTDSDRESETQSVTGETDENMLIGFERVDEVYLREHRGEWAIYDIERVEEHISERRRPDGSPIESEQ